jgi:inositol transport system permease protein
MNLIGVDSYIQQIIEGLIVVIAVAADIFSKNRKVTKVIIAPSDDDKDKKAKKS